MTLVRHELRQGWKLLAVWTAVIGFFVMVCVFLFPEMKAEMEGVSKMFSAMGAFTAAFGMDRLNFGTLIGFYAVECGNILGIGGAFFAALMAVNVLMKEEKDRTAEFLLAHPVSRVRLVTEKLAALLIQLIIMNGIIFAVSASSMMIIGENIPWKEMAMLHLAYFLAQVELTGICFGISAFLRRGSLGIGIGIAAVLYFLNLIANLSDQAEFLKYITPFGFADGADIIADGSLNGKMVLLGMAVALAGIGAAYGKYTRKDIQ
ncbi:MAG: ABC transporter permease subunit [Lachnospiraceae bacterium]|nr:ABC transporter permease subunit [Lachnospiraceae bacterium]